MLRLMRGGDFEHARKQAHSAASRFGPKSNPVWWLRFRLLEAESLLEMGKSDTAVALLKVDPSLTNPEYELKSRVLQVRSLVSVSNFSAANALIEEARPIAELSGRSDLRSEFALCLGQLLARNRKVSEASESYERAREDAQQSGDSWRVASALNGMGMVAVVRLRYEEAIPFFERAEKIWKDIDAPHSVAGARNNLGMCYTQLGDFDRALEYRSQVERMERPGILLANALGETGTLHLYQNNYDAAVSYYTRARDMASQFGAVSDAARWASNLTLALTAREDWDGAEKALHESLSLKPEPRSLPFMVLNEGAIAQGRGKLEEARRVFERAMQAAPQNPSIQWQAHAALANIAMTQGNIGEANHNFESAIAVIEKSRADLSRNELKLTFLARLIRFYQDYVDALVRQNKPVEAHALADSSRARILAERMAGNVERERPHKSADFQSIARKSGSVWLSYWLAPHQSFLWVTTRDEIRMFTLPPVADIARLVDEYRGFMEVAMRDPLQTPSEAGRRLYDVLIAPAAPLIARDSQVFIVPDGPLYQLGFDTIPVYGSATPRYWGDDVTTVIAPSFGVFRPDERPPRPERTALIIGDPRPAAAAYPKLPYTTQEIASIQKRFKKTTVIQGSDAQPAAYEQSNPGQYSVVHFAAHAEANRQTPLESAIILSPSDHGFRLSARELMNVPLQADLVTLSACRSSGARAYAGEGFVGLAWAFLHAGARSVIAGLWNVADQSTAVLMDALYAEIESGAPAPKALRRAKLALRKTDWAKPYYWGSFQCYAR